MAEASTPLDLLPTLLAPIMIGRSTPAREGLLLSVRGDFDEAVVVTERDTNFVVPLQGEFAFRYMVPGLGSSFRGALLSGTQVVVDVGSRFDPESKIAPLGSIVLRKGKPCLVASSARGGFNTLDELQLWGTCGDYDDDAAIGFTKWSFVVQDGTERRVVVSHEAPAVERT